MSVEPGESRPPGQEPGGMRGGEPRGKRDEERHLAASVAGSFDRRDVAGGTCIVLSQSGYCQQQGGRARRCRCERRVCRGCPCRSWCGRGGSWPCRHVVMVHHPDPTEVTRGRSATRRPAVTRVPTRYPAVTRVPMRYPAATGERTVACRVVRTRTATTATSARPSRMFQGAMRHIRGTSKRRGVLSILSHRARVVARVAAHLVGPRVCEGHDSCTWGRPFLRVLVGCSCRSRSGWVRFYVCSGWSRVPNGHLHGCLRRPRWLGDHERAATRNHQRKLVEALGCLASWGQPDPPCLARRIDAVDPGGRREF